MTAMNFPLSNGHGIAEKQMAKKRQKTASGVDSQRRAPGVHNG